MALSHLHDIDCGIDPRQLQLISALVAAASGQPVEANKSIVGDLVFTHEAVIYVDGLSKHAANHQAFDPAELGRRHAIVLDRDTDEAILRRVREHAMTHKRAPDDRRRLGFFDEFRAMSP